MIPKAALFKVGVTVLTVGVLGLTALTVRDTFFPKPLDQELRQTKSMLRNVFDKNKDLTTEVDELTKSRAEFLKEMEDKNKELADIKAKMEKQAAYVKTLTKKGDRLEKEVSLKPIQKEYEPVRQGETVKMPYPNRREGKPDIKFPFKEKPAEDPGKEAAVPAVIKEIEPEPAAESELAAEEKDEKAVETSSVAPPVETLPAQKSEALKVDAEVVKEEAPEFLPAVPVPAPSVDEIIDQKMMPVAGEEETPVETLAVPELVVEEPAVEQPVEEKQTEPAREEGLILEKSQDRQAEIDALQEEVRKLREERIESEKAWARKMEMLEADLKHTQLSKEEHQKLQTEIQALQEKGRKLSEKVKSANKVSAQDRVDYLYNLGVAYTQASMFKAAVEMYEKVLTIDPNDAASHYNLGILYDEHLNRTKEGLDHYKAYLLLSQDPEKKRDVENWIRISQYKVDRRTETHFESGSKAAKHLLVTTPD